MRFIHIKLHQNFSVYVHCYTNISFVKLSICRSRQNFVLPRSFHKNTRTIRVILLYPFSSLTISIHIRILEALLEKFLSNSYMLQTPRLFQGFSYNLHCLARHYNYSLHAFKFFICCQIKTSLTASTKGENISNNVRIFAINLYAPRHKPYLISYGYTIA